MLITASEADTVVRDEVHGREIPEFQEIAPALQEDAAAELIKVNDVHITPNSSVEILRAAGRFLGVSTSGSKRKIFDRMSCPCFCFAFENVGSC